jgi:hypothetical protein
MWVCSPRGSSIGWGPRLMKRKSLVQTPSSLPFLCGHVKKKKKMWVWNCVSLLLSTSRNKYIHEFFLSMKFHFTDIQATEVSKIFIVYALNTTLVDRNPKTWEAQQKIRSPTLFLTRNFTTLPKCPKWVGLHPNQTCPNLRYIPNPKTQFVKPFFFPKSLIANSIEKGM